MHCLLFSMRRQSRVDKNETRLKCRLNSVFLLPITNFTSSGVKNLALIGTLEKVCMNTDISGTHCSTLAGPTASKPDALRRISEDSIVGKYVIQGWKTLLPNIRQLLRLRVEALIYVQSQCWHARWYPLHLLIRYNQASVFWESCSYFLQKHVSAFRDFQIAPVGWQITSDCKCYFWYAKLIFYNNLQKTRGTRR